MSTKNFTLKAKAGGGKTAAENDAALQEALKKIVATGKIGKFDVNPDSLKIGDAKTNEVWQLSLTTGSDAAKPPVIVVACGKNGESDPIKLNKKNAFEVDTTETFSDFAIPADLGDIFKLRFGYPKSTTEESWQIKHIKLQERATNDTFDSDCDAWVIVNDKRDCWEEVPIIWPDYPSLPVTTYTIKVTMHERSSPGFDCAVWVHLIGELGTSGVRYLKATKEGNKNIFKSPTKTEVFEIRCVKLMGVKKIKMGHDNNGSDSKLFIEKAVVNNGKRDFEFPCGRYFSPEKGDKKYERFLEPGNEPDSDSEEPPRKRPPPRTPTPEPEQPPDLIDNTWRLWWENAETQEKEEVTVKFTLCGDDASSQDIPLTFSLQPRESEKHVILVDGEQLGAINKCRICFEKGKKRKHKWEIQKLHVQHAATEKIYTFEYDKPADPAEDGVVEASADKAPIRQYEVLVYTGDRPGCSTDAKIYLNMIGERGDSGKRWIVNPAEGKKSFFEPNQVDRFVIDAVDLGEIKTLKIGHNKKGKPTGWFLSKVVIRPTHRADMEYVFVFDVDMEDETKTVAVVQDVTDAEYDNKEWMMSWTNSPDQNDDFLQITAILFGKKGQSKSYYIDVALTAGDSEGYKVMMEDDIGDLVKVRLGYGPKVKHKPTWKIEEVRLKHLFSGKVYKFQLGGAQGGCKYAIEVHTGVGADKLENAKLYIKLTGGNGNTGKRWLNDAVGNAKKADLYKPDKIVNFLVELPDLGEITSMMIGHNLKKKKVGFFVKKVIIRPQHEKPREYVFDTMDDPEAVPESDWTIDWVNHKEQQKIKLKVFVAIYGAAGKTEDIPIQTLLGPGEGGGTKIKMKDPGKFKPYKVRVGFDQTMREPATWKLNVLRVKDSVTGTLFTFTLNNQTTINSEQDGWKEIPIDVDLDGQPDRPSVYRYKIDVHNGEMDAWPDIKMYCMLVGRRGDTGWRRLIKAVNNEMKLFKPVQMDRFLIEAVDLQDLTSIIIGHFGTGKTQAYFLDSCNISCPDNNEEWKFACNRWFDKEQDDGLIERELYPSSHKAGDPQSKTWRINTWTGKHPASGTKQPISVMICGASCTSDYKRLGKDKKFEFKPGAEDSFDFDVDLDDDDDHLGDVVKVRVGFDEYPAAGSTWFLERMSLLELSTGKIYHFTLNEWIRADQTHDSWREMTPENSENKLRIQRYQMTIWTGAEPGKKPPDASVYIYGANGDTGRRRLCRSKSNKAPLLPGQCDVFDIESAELGDIKKVVVHMPEGHRWKLDKFVVQTNPLDKEQYMFDCGRWLEGGLKVKNVFTPSIQLETESVKAKDPKPNEYVVLVSTGLQTDAGCDANVFVTVFGEKSQTAPIPLTKKSKADKVLFRPGTVDMFPLKLPVEQLGRPIKIRIEHDNSTPKAQWFLNKVALQDLHQTQSEVLEFDVNQWLSFRNPPGDVVKELPVMRTKEKEFALPVVKYAVEVFTGAKTVNMGGRVNDCYIIMIGRNDKSGRRFLKKNLDSNKLLSPGKANKFEYEAVGLGDLEKFYRENECYRTGRSGNIEAILSATLQPRNI